MKTEIDLIDNSGRTIGILQLDSLPFVPDVEETIHLDPTKFKPKIKGYPKDECLSVKVWKRSINIPRDEVTLKVVFDKSYGIPKQYGIL